MWNDLPFDLLAHIFSFLPPDSLACAKSACRNWHQCSTGCLDLSDSRRRRQNPAWFFAFMIRSTGFVCYAQNPIDNHRQYVLQLDLIPAPIQPVSPIGNGGLILLRRITDPVLQLAICNPFTREFGDLPILNVPRTNPAIGVVELLTIPGQFHFGVCVVGGTSVVFSSGNGSTYESSVEMYDSRSRSWLIIGPVPIDYSVRLTDWNSDEGVYCDEAIYWMTSAGAYSVIRFEIATNSWEELSVPIADRLEFAALGRRNGKLMLLGGKCGGDAYVWEHRKGDNMVWDIIEKVPFEIGMKFLGGKGCWDNTKCVCTDEMVCLYKDGGSGMLVWRAIDEKGKWEWFWVNGCCSGRGQQQNMQNSQLKSFLLHPNLGHSSHFDS